MSVRPNVSVQGRDGGRRWLLRGGAAGAGAMILAVVLVMAVVAVLVSDSGSQWGDRQTVTGVLFTLLWSLAAGVAGAVGAWQAAEGDAPDQASARLAGALGPIVLIVIVSLASLGGDGPSVVVVAIEALVESAAAVVGAGALARQLEAGW
jgi:peptidoglycan/LPS O-acetylase OafA/YrhL